MQAQSRETGSSCEINTTLKNEINCLAKCYEISRESLFTSELYGCFAAFKKADLEK